MPKRNLRELFNAHGFSRSRRCYGVIKNKKAPDGGAFNLYFRK